VNGREAAASTRYSAVPLCTVTHARTGERLAATPGVTENMIDPFPASGRHGAAAELRAGC